MKKPSLENAKVRTDKKSETIISSISGENNIGFGKKYFVKTYGCQMNEHDTENIKAILDKLKYEETEDYNDADLILLNTCSIRENAHNKVFGMIGRLKKIKEEKPEVVVGLCGCMAQEEVVVDKIMEKYSWLDLVFGTHNIVNLPLLIERQAEKNEIEVEVFSKEGEIYENIPVKRQYKHKAFINVMYGCDKFCTYCIVPYTRGKQRSRKSEYIIKEVEELVKEDCMEVTLLGQNVNAYGKDLEENYKMADLLRDVAKTGIKRIRFMTSHPWDFTDDMIEVIKENNNVTPYVHLPVQSGSSKILKTMGRKYTKDEYLALYEKIKKEIPNVTISTDIIVGFPNETNEDFNETLEVVDKCKFDFAFTFIFSKREGTPASKMEDNISKEEKKERLQILNKKINKYSLESNEKLSNKKVSVLVDGYSEKDKTILTGYTEGMKRVNFKGDASLIGQIIDVKIVEAKTWSLKGEL